MKTAFSATYSDMKLIKTRRVVQIILEIPMEEWQTASAILGGIPDPGAETWVAIARLDPKSISDEFPGEF